MNSGGPGEASPSSGGEFLLSLLQKSGQKLPQLYQQIYESSSSSDHSVWENGLQQRFASSIDPAVTEVGPAVVFHHQHSPVLWQSSAIELASPPNALLNSSVFPQGGGLLSHGLPQTAPSAAAPPHLVGNQQKVLQDNLFRLGFPSVQSHHARGGPWNLQFGSIRETPEGFVSSGHEGQTDSWRSVRDSSDIRRSQQSVRPPPGFMSRPQGRGMGIGVGNGRAVKQLDRNVAGLNIIEDEIRLNGERRVEHFERRNRSVGSLHSVSPSNIETSFGKLSLMEASKNGKAEDSEELNDGDEEVEDSYLAGNKPADRDPKHKRSFREKEARVDSRGQMILNQRMRMTRSRIQCRPNVDKFNDSFLSIFESLIPLEDDQAKQKQLLARLEKIINKEWPEARLYLYGSCANSFGVSKSDIDVCLAIDANLNKSEVLLKLSDMLESEEFQNVQALTRARVPIVKLMDPVTGVSCDICINNLLAVVNTKLLRDYARIDSRLRQLAFIVKHWAKSRSVNETYHGTLSSYAYVLMCIHFLQERVPAILPCLQGMQPTYSVVVDDIECSFFDKVEQLDGFGSANRESIARLVWGFFHYWAYCHDYAYDVVSVRTGSILSKRNKDWTRRVGNDRHLICIEDPFETSHDLGRVVDKFSIRVLRQEFERAAEIMQCDPNPCSKLFERYIPG